MAEKDAAEKLLEAYNDVFADIVNVLLFGGREVLKPGELTDMASRSVYRADGELHEMERDVAKRWKKENIRIACIGLENQTESDPDMPLRVLAYDGAEYRTEMKTKDRYPVITLVLYFGYKRHWSGPKRLLECFDVPEEFREYVNDYKLNLFEIAYLKPEQVKLFRSDFRIVADYFTQMRANRGYEPEPVEFQHVQETLQLLHALTKDGRYEAAYNDFKMREAPKNMCEVLDRIENQGIAKGKVEGETSILTLMQKLFAAGRVADAEKASNDKAYCAKLLAEFGLA